MADNIAATPGSGATLAADEIGGVLFGRSKIVIGADGVNDGDVSAANPMPVSDAAIPAAGQALMAASLPVAIASDQSAVPVSGPLTNAQLRGTPVDIIGVVAATVSGIVSATGPLTDAELRATPIPVSGTVTATGPLTDTQLRATAVPVSGTVAVTGPLTDTQIRATALPVSNANLPAVGQKAMAASVPVVLASDQSARLASATTLQTISAGGSAAAGLSVSGRAPATFQATVSGTGTVTATVLIQVSNDGTNWITLGTITLSGTTSATDGFASSAPWAYVRSNCTAISGTSAALSVVMGA